MKMSWRFFPEFQFTHPGGVRRALSNHVSLELCVSIHAPGRGATEVAVNAEEIIKGFNSRTREGCDLYDPI